MKHFVAKIKIFNGGEDDFSKFKTCDYKELLQRVIRFGIESGLPKEYIIANGFDYPKELVDDVKQKPKYSALTIGATISINDQNYAVVDKDKFPQSQELQTDNGAVNILPLKDYLFLIGEQKYDRIFSDQDYVEAKEFVNECNLESDVYFSERVKSGEIEIYIVSDVLNDKIAIKTAAPQEKQDAYVFLVKRYKNALKAGEI